MTEGILSPVYRQLREDLSSIEFGPPTRFVYNPLEYAENSHEAYLSRFAHSPKRVVFLGMNPGPFGMAQTGIPFGDVETVGEWLQIHEPIGKPKEEHPKRPVLGLDCPRIEVSGARLWGWVRSRWVTPEAFFAEAFVANYCPLVFLEDGGRNRTPDRLPRHEKGPLFAACDRALKAVVDHLEPKWVVGIGAFAAARATSVLEDTGVKIGRILHPSPASPAANRGWSETVQEQLHEQKILTRTANAPEVKDG